MNKTELVERIAHDADVSVAAASRMLESFIASVTQTIKRGGVVQIKDFGAFSAAKRAGRMVVNPRTGVPMKIKAHKSPKFSPGKKLKASIG